MASVVVVFVAVAVPRADDVEMVEDVLRCGTPGHRNRDSRVFEWAPENSYRYTDVFAELAIGKELRWALEKVVSNDG